MLRTARFEQNEVSLLQERMPFPVVRPSILLTPGPPRTNKIGSGAGERRRCGIMKGNLIIRLPSLATLYRHKNQRKFQKFYLHQIHPNQIDITFQQYFHNHEEPEICK
ncbi:MAG: hypothetical protein P0Y59_01115 [Candidatus Sphingomonas phytovorans]|nr:hypothetical protein [Sphingomonas sp.]WEK00328.1 MAG: hypothetical protein P0Y59_01115 [Sphingomonas sp.]